MRKLTEVKIELGHRSYKLNVLGLYVLHSLSNGPKNGYDLLKELKRLTNNKWVPPKSTIYPLLKKMVEEGLLDVDEHGVYSLTEAGRAVLKALRRNSEAINELEENISLILKIIEEIKSEVQTQE
ncbi:PadR family transcriptional regulator [Ignicoccus hospitalis]|uniref:Transcriptional regulator, PadR family n=1 Tax=Ignicoccus hospitalis (strain KIN4/I / DSM 18386 / JCM 14125) TaxID=453591 RepID=A8AAT8_IGNH4|nr:PadR family transcriptional regulator [Ignicoccus hospitalis]ABU82040.1 transcriptional regulator, PadR family [Ignicoccus hospitalis KIN4/I]HIH90997.1 PadR family transcriptional regulator [Desulfurococcaceae archaeon]